MAFAAIIYDEKTIETRRIVRDTPVLSFLLHIGKGEQMVVVDETEIFEKSDVLEGGLSPVLEICQAKVDAHAARRVKS